MFTAAIVGSVPPPGPGDAPVTAELKGRSPRTDIACETVGKITPIDVLVTTVQLEFPP